jgi:NAD(P)-dependent dehydrogenase (short-subunit alcohol dehydrogenase family)
MPAYQHSGPIDCNTPLKTENLQGKTAIVTGGANGLGEAYVRALLAAGSIVIVGDLDDAGGKALVSEFPHKVHFVRCNVTSWEDQANLFEEAVASSPTGKIHYVVANAGIIRPDDVFSYSGENKKPMKPELSTIDVNIKGTLYTSKLAMHYFIKQNGTTPSDEQEDTCLVLVGSGAGIHDCLRIPQYSASKWAARGIMHSLRRTAHFYGSRVNVIHPWYVRTKILSDEVFETVKAKGVEFATVEDAGQCLLRILSDATVNGRSLFIAARKWAAAGYMDLDLEDTEENELRKEIQFDQMRPAPAEDGLFE